MNAVTKQQLIERVIRAIEQDSRARQKATTTQLRKTSERLANEVRKAESVFQRAGEKEPAL